MSTMIRARPPVLISALALAASASGCGDDLVDVDQKGLELECSIPLTDIHRGAFRGAIPALTNPELGSSGDPGTGYLEPDSRVVGQIVDGEPIAIPLNIFWWHEIVNLDTQSGPIAVTHCPLTGSTLAFRRDPVDGAEFDVSGLLYENNLMMFNRTGEGEVESLWPQMARGARCGPKDGTALPMIPTVEMTWDGWRDFHPDTKVVTSNTGFIRDYTEYPYDDYDHVDNTYTLFPVTGGLDTTHPPKELALGVPDGNGADVFPFDELRDFAFIAVVHGSTSQGQYVVFWDRTVEAAAAFRPVLDGQSVTFVVEGGRIFDDATGSEWDVTGVATAGSLAGTRLEPVAEAFVAFWFAWPVFYPRSQPWTSP